MTGKKLPEKYNGLGYSNLICILSQIIGFCSEIKDIKNNLNLIFIEEPEAHMHPQMQSVFIKNINGFLDEVGLNTQIIMTTHSSHILSGSGFTSIRYFTRKTGKNFIVVKDLMDFNENLNEPETIEFLIQYLTLGKCDLFFADKAILFEGTVERILLPVFIEKIDNEMNGNKLSEQYISAIEIGGAYMDKFKELLVFLELKTLIVTDIDSIENVNRTKVEISNDAELITSNVALKDWLPGEENILALLSKSDVDKISGSIRVAYQIKHGDTGVKCGRSFEEAFIIDNEDYIFDHKDTLASIKYCLRNYKTKEEIQSRSFEIQKFIDRNKKKTDLAFDLLNIMKNDWEVPTYIKEGLIWLAQ